MKNYLATTLASLEQTKIPSLAEQLEQRLGGRNFVIYGAGAFGREMCSFLQSNGYMPQCFLDRYAAGFNAPLPIVRPADFEDKTNPVVLAIVLTASERSGIYAYLRGLGYNNIIDAQEFQAARVPMSLEQSPVYFQSQKDEIFRPFSYLSDAESQKVYGRNLAAHFLRDYSIAYESQGPEQYFGLVRPGSLHRFVDCGAYIGDTFQRLLAYEAHPEQYVALEPLSSSFSLLAETVRESGQAAVLLPLAASDENGFSRFSDLAGSSALTPEGNLTVHCARLDDVLGTFQPTFIKMDIEGAEMRALYGAEKIIANSAPDLAICVYHAVDHFWQIPNLIFRWSQKYKLPYRFYLRSHSSATMETVFYALKETQVS